MPGPARVQGLVYCLGSAKQANISTASTTYIRVPKLDMGVPFSNYGTETDKDWIGKGSEFVSATGVYPTAKTFGGSASRYGSAEWMLWSWVYALGHNTLASSLYTATPLANATSLEPPYFSLLAQLAGGGGTLFDETHIGCAVEEVVTEFKYGPTLASITNNCTYIGSGKITTPSGVSAPSVLSEKYMHSQSMAITINGIDYVAGSPGAATMLMGSIGWKNNIIAPLMYYPGSGSQDGAAIGGRMLIGNRVPTLNFTAFLQSDSTEYAKLVAQTNGTAVITFTFDATHFCTFTFAQVSFSAVTRTTEEGIVAVSVTCEPKTVTGDGTDVVTVSGKCAITDICQ